MTGLLLAALIAFPKEGQKLPFVERCYLSGCVEPGVTNVVVQGRDVAVHPQGGWVTMVDVAEGANVFEVAGARRTFFVAKRPKPALTMAAGAEAATATATIAPPKEKVYKKLEYAGDVPKAKPVGKAPEIGRAHV